jgi:hypothetical protein
MRETIPVVSAELIMAASDAAARNHGNADPAISIVMALGKLYPAEALLPVTYRLHALANLLAADHGKEWTITIAGKGYTLLNEALLRAAAKAPLETHPEQVMGDLSFDPPTFLRIALEESQAQGTG